ncbi:MAG: hypothetical protein WC763_04520 [Candidatus Paceibacterota bacterium]|jgi:hypothetical protein
MQTALSATAPLFTLAAKGMNVPESVSLVRSMLETLEISGRFTLAVGERLRSNGGQPPHIKVKSSTTSSLTLDVKHNSKNDSYHRCYLRCDEVKGECLRNMVMDKLGASGGVFVNGMAIEPKVTTVAKEQAKVVAFPSQSPETLSGPAGDNTTTKGQEGKSLLGFTHDKVLVGLLLDSIKEGYGSRPFTSDQFRALMRSKGLVPKDSPNKALGQIMSWCFREGHLIKGAEGMMQLSVDTRQPSRPESVVKAPSLAPQADFQSFIRGLAAQVKRYDSAISEKERVDSRISACDAKIRRLKAEIDPLIAERDALVRKSLELNAVVEDPGLIEAKESMGTIKSAVNSLEVTS